MDLNRPKSRDGLFLRLLLYVSSLDPDMDPPRTYILTSGSKKEWYFLQATKAIEL